ncbi:hypothetical protein Syun_026596 [Stephania yunnanensis]|uniref:Uncharacterized protein n=1 Tax=Stephania yunnanensis TaxID=152371 RepID=A0AAP0EUL1_9MAGN
MHIRKIRIKIGWKKKGVFWFIKRGEDGEKDRLEKEERGRGAVGEGKEEEGRRAARRVINWQPKTQWTWTRGIDYERVVRFVKPKGKTLEYLFYFVYSFNYSIPVLFIYFILCSLLDGW